MSATDLATAGVIIASIAVGITTLGIVLSDRRTRKSNQITQQSNELLERELSVKLRPVLTVGMPYPEKVKLKRSQIPWDEFNEKINEIDVDSVETILYSFKIQNIGLVPARNIAYHEFWSETKITRNNLKEIESKLIEGHVLQPNEESSFGFGVGYYNWMQLEKHPIFYANRISYFLDEQQTKKAEVGKIFQLKKGEITNIESWVDP